MLCQFSFQNFKSYKNETTFDMQADNIPEFSESLIKRDPCSSLLPVSVIYGPNGGGKSNLLYALSYLITHVVEPVYRLKSDRISTVHQDIVSAEPFLFNTASVNEPMEFQIFFYTCGNEYRYYLSLYGDEIVTEVLDQKKGEKEPERIYYREKSDILLGTPLQGENINTSVNPRIPFLSFLSITYNIPIIVEVLEWFESCLILNHDLATEELIWLRKEDRDKEQLLSMLNGMDIDILDYRIEKNNNRLFTKRKIRNRDYELPIEAESNGTRKLVAILPLFQIALQEGRLMIIDELDAKLHPKLLRYIISLFKDPEINHYGAQLLFTSHDISTMKSTVFRRDEIWFAALDAEHSSEIYSLSDIHETDGTPINSRSDFDRDYLAGRYGADPYLKKMLKWR